MRPSAPVVLTVKRPPVLVIVAGVPGTALALEALVFALLLGAPQIGSAGDDERRPAVAAVISQGIRAHR